MAVFAAFDRDLYFGVRADPEVTKMQEFIRDQGIYAGPITGNFFTLTREGVKKFQEKEGIKPAAGYFGRLTRARANEILKIQPKSETALSVSGLTAKIQTLQDELILLKKKQAEEVKPTPPAPSENINVPKPIALPPAPTNKVIISGKSSIEFPAVETNPLKFGEFFLHNDTANEVLLTNIETILSDEMDSTPNRNRRVYFLVRDGAGVYDTLVSKTEFTFFLTPPQVGSPQNFVLRLPLDLVLKAGEKKTFSLWIELLKYVRSGTLKIESTKLVSTSEVAVGGSFGIVLTKEPPL